jgi:hypothetical protein
LSKYQLEECRPAISVYEYWNRIHHVAGYQWEWKNFDSDQIRMDKLYIPYNGDKPKISDQLSYQVAAERTTTSTMSTTAAAGTVASIPSIPQVLNTEVLDLLGLYDPTTGIYTANLNTGTGAIDVTFEITYSVQLNNTSAGNAFISGSFIGPLPTITYKPYVKIGPLGAKANFGITSLASVIAGNLTPGVNVISSGTVITSTIPVTSIIIGTTIQPSIGLDVVLNKPITYRDTIVGGSPVVVNPSIVITDIKMIIIPRVDTYGFGGLVNFKDFIPAKIKQSDFIKSIVNMYNLVIVPDATNDRRIIYQTRDDYYDGGIEKDWTNKIATDKGSDISFISNTNAKKITLSYKPDTDVVNKDYLAETKEVYGQLEYELQNQNIKGLETKEIIFSPTPIDNTPFGTYAPMYSGQLPKCNIRILIDGGEQPTGLAGAMTYDIIDYTVGTVETGIFGIDTYPMLTHQDNPNTPLFDINFGLCDKYYHDFTSVTNNNLYSMFWRRTIGQVDNGKLFTAYFYLNEYDISILKLSDKIFVKDTWYNINSLQYDPNSFGPTKVVLMTIDDELAIDIIKPRPGLPLSGTLTVAVLSELIYSGLNWNYADSSVVIQGTGNVVTGDIKNVLVVGNNRIVDSSNTVYSENVVADNIILNGTDLQDVFNNVLINATINVPSADVLNLGTTPYLLIDSPGAGYFIQVLTASCKVNFNTTAYATSTTLYINTDTANIQQHNLIDTLNTTLTRIGVSSQQVTSVSDTQLISDKAIYLTSAGVDPTAGDSDIVIYLSYKIIQE